MPDEPRAEDMPRAAAAGAERRTPYPGGAAPPASREFRGRRVTLEPLAREICRRYLDEFPDIRTRYGDATEAWCVHDAIHLVNWALHDIELGLGGQFYARECRWLASVLRNRGFPLEQLARTITISLDVLGEALPDAADAFGQLQRDGLEAVGRETETAR